ncbi:ABC transporter permease [Kitasatospora sp. NBC_01287]|uniref:ABC transporter permease subunit n=1 Tax=Kitasatospora sp. NBC_01287 TaxID=2903573 RepID=UPI0022598040|nr:ABC transporter permease subunit [Kitasatospora sp. NBC_01287]MCX4746254.1 ABC transporter permease [Kitasatospora sp. NBC_01287]
MSAADLSAADLNSADPNSADLSSADPSVGTRPVAPARAARLRPRGLAWLMWRQNRLLLRVWLVLLLAAVVAAPFLRAGMVSFISGHHIAGCAEISMDPACQNPSTQQAVSDFRGTYGTFLKGLGALLLLVLPAGFGAGLGAPLLAQELETGTWKLALAQSVGRDRWVAAKLLTAALIGSLGAAVPALLLHWLWQPSANDVSGIGWYSLEFFGSGGPVLVATVLLAIAVGALAGVVLRRVLPAMAVTLGLVWLAQWALAVVRPHLWAWNTEVVDPSSLPNSVWGFGQGYLTPDGHRLPSDHCSAAVDYQSCSANLRGVTDLHHAADYWPLQLVESGICLAVAAALTALTVRWARRRFG